MQTLNKKTIGFLICGLVLGFAHRATAEEPNYRPFTISAEASTTGLGGSVSWRFSDNFGVRGGVNYYSYDTEQFTYTTKPTGVGTSEQKFDGTARLLSEPIALDYYPSAKSSFRISVGVLINQNRFTANVPNSGVPGSSFVLNGVDYVQSGCTNGLDLEVKQQTISPYLSVGGSIYLDKSHHWSLSGELGVAYTGSPQVSLTAPNHDVAFDSNPDFANDLNAEEQSIQKDADKFYPIVKIGVSYSF